MAWYAENSGITARKKRYRYTGKERDDWTGLSYHGARYYMPWLGRWESADPAGMVDGVNRYAYVRGNPISGRDPSGMGTVGACTPDDPDGIGQPDQAKLPFEILYDFGASAVEQVAALPGNALRGLAYELTAPGVIPGASVGGSVKGAVDSPVETTVGVGKTLAGGTPFAIGVRAQLAQDASERGDDAAYEHHVKKGGGQAIMFVGNVSLAAGATGLAAAELAPVGVEHSLLATEAAVATEEGLAAEAGLPGLFDLQTGARIGSREAGAARASFLAHNETHPGFGPSVPHVLEEHVGKTATQLTQRLEHRTGNRHAASSRRCVRWRLSTAAVRRASRVFLRTPT